MPQKKTQKIDRSTTIRDCVFNGPGPSTEESKAKLALAHAIEMNARAAVTLAEALTKEPGNYVGVSITGADNAQR